MRPLELYIHIPFCVKKCKYCDFLSGPASAGQREVYVESLCRDIRSYADLAKAYRVVSIFVGGGTPSTLTGDQMQRLFFAINDTFSVEKNAEITIEMNPGTVDAEKLSGYKKCGINRLSIGLQSTKNRELQTLGRIHTYEEFLKTYQMARKAGFTNINIDLMSAIPGQKLSDWEENLRTVAELEPEHISAYSLIVEEGTPFYEEYGEGRHADELPDEETERKMYWETKEILETYGYERYEISNYAKPGFACKHNLGYWERKEYLGIGTGAASLIDNCRFNYGEEPQKLERSEQIEETMFLGLRKMQGVSKKQFEKTVGVTMESIYEEVLKDMEQKGLLENDEEYVRLTARGIDVSNYVMSEFLL